MLGRLISVRQVSCGGSLLCTDFNYDGLVSVECIRAQRAFSIQMPDQYVFCHLAFLEYVLNMGYAEEIDLTGFDEEVLPE